MRAASLLFGVSYSLFVPDIQNTHSFGRLSGFCTLEWMIEIWNKNNAKGCTKRSLFGVLK